MWIQSIQFIIAIWNRNVALKPKAAIYLYPIIPSGIFIKVSHLPYTVCGGLPRFYVRIYDIYIDYYLTAGICHRFLLTI